MIVPLWSAPPERSSDGAFVDEGLSDDSKAASRFACRRTPYVSQWTRVENFPLEQCLQHQFHLLCNLGWVVHSLASSDSDCNESQT